MAKPVSTALWSCCGGKRCEDCLNTVASPLLGPGAVSAGDWPAGDGLNRKLDCGCCCGGCGGCCGGDGLKPLPLGGELTTPNCWFCDTTWPLGRRTVWKFPLRSCAGGCGANCCWDCCGCPGGGRPNGLNRVVNWLKPFRNGWKNVPGKGREEKKGG